jgi:Transposase, Mutator family
MCGPGECYGGTAGIASRGSSETGALGPDYVNRDFTAELRRLVGHDPTYMPTRPAVGSRERSSRERTASQRLRAIATSLAGNRRGAVAPPDGRRPSSPHRRSTGCIPPPANLSSTASPTDNDNDPPPLSTPAVTTPHHLGDHHDADADTHEVVPSHWRTRGPITLAGDPAEEPSQEAAPAAVVIDEQLARRLVEEARTKGVSLLGPGGLLGGLTKQVLETSLEVEMTDHLGYDRHAAEGRNSGNSRNGRRSKTVITEVGPVTIEVPRDRDGSFEPQIVRKRQRRMAGIDPLVLSLSARGLTHGEISAHFAEVYQASVSKETVTPSPRCTRRRSPKRPSPGSPTRCWSRWSSGRTGRSTALGV